MTTATGGAGVEVCDGDGALLAEMVVGVTTLGGCEGDFVGVKLGDFVGDKLGDFVGDTLGHLVGAALGDRVGVEPLHTFTVS